MLPIIAAKTRIFSARTSTIRASGPAGCTSRCPSTARIFARRRRGWRGLPARCRADRTNCARRHEIAKVVANQHDDAVVSAISSRRTSFSPFHSGRSSASETNSGSTGMPSSRIPSITVCFCGQAVLVRVFLAGPIGQEKYGDAGLARCRDKLDDAGDRFGDVLAVPHFQLPVRERALEHELEIDVIDDRFVDVEDDGGWQVSQRPSVRAWPTRTCPPRSVPGRVWPRRRSAV